MLNNILLDSNQIFLIVLGVLLVAFLIYSFISGNKRKKRMEEEQAKRNDIHPGYKVTTIGGIIGTVVSVDEETNSFVLMTGDEENQSHIKFDKQAIYMSENPNAVVEPLEKIAEENGEDNKEADAAGEEAAKEAEGEKNE